MTQLCLPLFSKFEVERIKKRIRIERSKRWAKSNPEKDREIHKRYRWKNPEIYRKARKRSYQKNRERRLEMNKQYRKTHPDIMREKWRRYREKYRDHVKKLGQQWRKNNPDKVKVIQDRIDSKRRTLGFIALNMPFENAVGHHIDKSHVVYIPEELHRSISHNVRNGHGMSKINAKVFEWLSQQSKTMPLLEVMSATS
jgi:hypothetical protein